MRAGTLSNFVALALLAALLPADDAAALSTLTGADAVSAFFDPNLTQPRLQLSGDGSVENSGGVAIFDADFGYDAFTMDVGFLGNAAPDAYEDILITAALADGVDYSGVSIRLSLGAEVLSLSFDDGDFTDAATFGLPFPPDGINGIGNGSGDYLSLNGALVAGWDLESALVRGVNDPLSLQIEVFGLSDPNQLIRFDVFGLNAGSIVIGNNPNSGAAGVNPVPEPAAVALYLAGLAVVGVSIRRQLARP